jgi:hypothetical protein
VVVKTDDLSFLCFMHIISLFFFIFPFLYSVSFTPSTGRIIVATHFVSSILVAKCNMSTWQEFVFT